MSAGPTRPTSPLPDLPRRIVLTGFMGAGKSTVGRMLAARLRWPFLDTDALITAEHGLTVAQIFAQDGEEHFRRIEAEVIARVLDPLDQDPLDQDPLHRDPVDGHDHAIVALGGGAIETEPVRKLLFDPGISVPATVTIFLSAPLPELLSRCHVNAPISRDTCAEETERPPVRPLLTAPEPPEDRLARRLPHYRQAHLTVDTAGIPPIEVVDRIVDWLSAGEWSAARSSAPPVL